MIEKSLSKEAGVFFFFFFFIRDHNTLKAQACNVAIWICQRNLSRSYCVLSSESQNSDTTTLYSSIKVSVQCLRCFESPLFL